MSGGVLTYTTPGVGVSTMKSVLQLLVSSFAGSLCKVLSAPVVEPDHATPPATLPDPQATASFVASDGSFKLKSSPVLASCILPKP